MSGFGTPLGPALSSAGPKQISSRLLNMKFMQRAAVSASPKDSSPRSDLSSERPLKRRRTGEDFSTTVNNINSPSTPTSLDHTTTTNNPGTPWSTELNPDSTRKGTNNFNPQGEETEWVLDVKIPNATTEIGHVSNGHTLPYTEDGNIDDNDDSTNNSDDDDDDDDEDNIWSTTPHTTGRRIYGAYKKSKTTTQKKGPTGTTTTTTTTRLDESTTPKRGSEHDDDYNNEDSNAEDSPSIPSNSDFEQDDDDDDNDSETGIRKMKKKSSASGGRNKAFDFASEADMKRMDDFDYQKAGNRLGLGRQRSGLGSGPAAAAAAAAREFGGRSRTPREKGMGSTSHGRREGGGRSRQQPKRS